MVTEKSLVDGIAIGRALVLRQRTALLIAASLLMLCGSVHAQLIYTCTTADGKRISADWPPPECTNRRIHVQRRDGTPLPDIEPPPTPEEIRRREAEEKRKLDEKDEKRRQERRDRSLLATYASIEEIEAARRRSLADLQKLVDRGLAHKADLQRERKKLDDEAEFYAKREIPESLKRAFAANNESIHAQDKGIENTKAEMDRVNKLFDGYARRFKELVEAGATPAQRNPDKN